MLVVLVAMMIILACCILLGYLKTESFQVVDQYPTNADLIIVTSHHSEDLKWFQNTKLPVVVCSKVLDSPFCSMNVNKGREVTAFLKFIMDNYDRLPKHVAFLHGHETAWHQTFKKPLLEIIESCANYTQYGFVSLNNHPIDDRKIESNDIMKRLHKIWDPIFRPFLQRDAPNYLFADCCAQFIVARERIRRLPVDAYKRWFKYITEEDPFNDNGYTIGFMFEYIWHIIFGEPDIVPMSEHRKMFRCDM